MIFLGHLSPLSLQRYDNCQGQHLERLVRHQIESYNNFIRSEKRVIATIGVKDLIIVDSDNATLILSLIHI